MKKSFHLNLLQPEEVLSPNPVRLRIMLPLFALLFLLGVLVWWGLQLTSLHGLRQRLAVLEGEITSLQPSHTHFAALCTAEQNCKSELEQLGYYQRAKREYGELLLDLPHVVAAEIQLTEIHMPMPERVRPLLDKKKRVIPMFSTNEVANIQVSGRASGSSPSESINGLLGRLRSDFTNIIVNAKVPAGAFRQDTMKQEKGERALLFDISCECYARRFE